MAKARDPFDLQLDQAQRDYLGNFLYNEVYKAIAARTMAETDVDYCWRLYEQARTRNTANSPWPNAADLTSYIASEKVDALHARILRTIWSEPVWTVEGWGEAADRAPFVEEFHQWKVEEERLQSILDKLVLASLVEPRGLLEVAEGTEIRVRRKTITAKIQTDPTTGGAIFGVDGKPQLAVGPDGKYLESSDPNELSAQVVVDEGERVRTGPMYRVLPYRDSLILPAHAREESDIWGYGKRFWRLWSEVKRLAGTVYDKETVEHIASSDDRAQTLAPALARSGVSVVPSQEMAEKEFWELVVLLDIEFLFERHGLPVPTVVRGEGPRWYLATVHYLSSSLLRFQFDDLERSRFVPVILFPRPDRATEGFSFVGHKLLTMIEEHTAVRNMRADREALVNSAPIKRMQGALWDPYEQPWGPGAVIDVRDPSELQAMVVPPISGTLIEWTQEIERAAEKIAGINDISSGQFASQSRTLGEIQMATTNSEIRMDLVTRRLQESMEDLAQIRHAIWKRALASRPDGEALPPTLVQNLEGRGVSIDAFLPDQKITAALLAGAFKFKPHGSVETADLNRQRADAVGFMQFLPMFLRLFPQQAAMFQNPQASRALLRWVLQVFRVPNVNAILGSVAQDLQQSQGMPQLPPQFMAMMQAMGGGPGGATGPGVPAPPGLGGSGGSPVGASSVPPSLPPAPPGVM